MLAIGSTAPIFALRNQDEVEISLKDLVGKWVVLYFYPKDSTPGCTQEACEFSEALEEFDNMDAVIFGVSPDTPKKHKNFIDKNNLKITLLVDETKDTIKAYDAWGVKKMCGKEYEGVIRSTYIITPNGEIAYAWNNVKVKGHVQEVQNKLKSLKA